MNWIKKRMYEPSTWRGIIGFGGLIAGYTVSPDMENSIIALVLAGLSLVEVIRKEKNEPAK